MYTSLLNHLILIAPSFPSRLNTHYRMTLSNQLGKSYSTKWWICQHKTIWYVCIPIRMNLSAEAQLLANTNHYLKFSLTMLSMCWHQQTFLIELSTLSWRYLLILQHYSPFWATCRPPAEFTDSTCLCSWPWEALCCETHPGDSRGVMLWKYHQHGIISYHGGKEHSLLFLSL